MVTYLHSERRTCKHTKNRDFSKLFVERDDLSEGQLGGRSREIVQV